MTFAADTAVAPAGPGRYSGQLRERWLSLVGIHGGYTAAVVVNAITAAVDDPSRALRSFATQFAAVPRPGPVDIEVTAERTGRSMTTTGARLLQDGQVLQVAHAASSTTRPGLTYDDHDRPRDADPGDVPRFTSPGATIGFDAIGGGKLTGQILTAMEAALRQAASAYSLYGSTTRKRVYIYGALDPGPTEISRSFGLSWDVGDWQVTPFLAEVGPEVVQRLRARVVAELKTTFASSYSQEISLAQALNIDTLRDYRRTATGEKYLITPNKAL